MRILNKFVANEMSITDAGCIDAQPCCMERLSIPLSANGNFKLTRTKHRQCLLQRAHNSKM